MGWQIKTKAGALYGPVNSDILQQWIQQKRVLDEDFVWIEDKKQWVIIKSVSQLQDLFKEGNVHPAKKQGIPKVNIPTPKDLSETLYDDKKTLTDQLIADAWRAMLAKGIWSIIGAILLMGLLIIVGGLIIGFGIAILNTRGFTIAFGRPIAQIIIMILVAPLTLGWTAYFLRIARREKADTGTVFVGFKGKYIFQSIGAILLMWLLPTLAGIISFGIWSIYLQLSYMMSYFFIFDENRGPWQGMKASFDVTKGFKCRIIALQIVSFLLGILFLGIGLFVTIPLSQIALASLYYRIRTGRISEKHLQTSFGEYLIVLIPSIIVIALTVVIVFVVLGKHLPFLSPQIEQIIKNLPLKT